MEVGIPWISKRVEDGRHGWDLGRRLCHCAGKVAPGVALAASGFPRAGLLEWDLLEHVFL